MFLLIVTLLAIIFIVEIFTPFVIFLIAPGFVENDLKYNLAIEFSRITFPFLLFVSISSFFSGILNANNKFAAAAAAPIILNIVLIISLVISYIFRFRLCQKTCLMVFLYQVYSNDFFGVLFKKIL